MFLAAPFLWGMAALGLPVLIHMMQSPRARLINFPSVRFLKICRKNAVRRTRLKNLILLLLRMLLLALIVFGMAKPFQKNETTEALPEAAISMVIVLDNSYSMGYVDRGTMRFEQAKLAAIGLVDSLKPGDDVAVILMNEKPVPYVRELSTDLERVRKVLREAELAIAGTKVEPSLREALRIVQKPPAATPEVKPGEEAPDLRRRREVHVLTDLQASSWSDVLKGNFLKTVDTTAKIYVSSFGRKGSPNSFIESATVTASGTHETTITAKVRASGAGSPGNIITLNVNDRNVTQEAFAVRPGTPTPVPLVTQFSDAGSYRCVLSLQDDDLNIDDRYYFTVEVGERSTVLVVDGEPSAVEPLAETFYLWAAFNPGAVAGGAAPSDARRIGVATLPTTSLEGLRCVILCNVGHLDGAELIKIENHLREGGSVMIFTGRNVNAEEYNQWTCLPIALTQPVGDAAKRQSFGFGEVRGNHPLFARKLDLRSARFFICYGSDRNRVKDGGAILRSFDNGQPALIEYIYEGKGKVLLFTSTCDLEWTNFPLRRAFLPWLYQAMYYLSNQDTEGKAYKLHEKVKFQALAAEYKKSISVTDPAGNRTVLRPQVKGGSAEVLFTGTSLPGMYQVDADEAFSNSAGFGVNLGVSESILTVADQDGIESAAPAGMISFLDVTALASVPQEMKDIRGGKEYWPMLFKLALLLFIVESLFGNFISRTKKAGGMEQPLFEVLKQRTPGIE